MELAFHKHAMLYHFLDWGFWAQIHLGIFAADEESIRQLCILQTHTDVELEPLEKRSW